MASEADVLAGWNTLPLSPLEDFERLEQLRLIEAGYEIATFLVEGTSLSVDTAEQLEMARQLARQGQTVYKNEIFMNISLTKTVRKLKAKWSSKRFKGLHSDSTGKLPALIAYLPDKNQGWILYFFMERPGG